MLVIDRQSLNALKILGNAWSDNRSGVPYEELDFDDDTFLFLLNNQLIKAPQTIIANFHEEPLIFFDGMIYITPQGRGILEAREEAISEAEEIRHHNTKQEKQTRFYNQTAVASLIVSILSFTLGIIVEYQSGILGHIISLLG